MMAQGSDDNVQQGSTESDPSIWIEVSLNGPYIVRGTPPLNVQTITPNAKGNSWTYTEGKAFAVKDRTALCRCGHSKNKPYCDGTHNKVDVDLTETASFAPLLDGSQEIDGPSLALTDNEKYCAFARFCDNAQSIWNEVQMPGEEAGELSVYMAHHCPSGRLIVWDRSTGQPIEQPLPASLSLLEDPAEGCSAGLIARGGIRVVSASGRSYEIRNRQALCRCGQSGNKPFCDGSHASVKFDDGLT